MSRRWHSGAEHDTRAPPLRRSGWGCAHARTRTGPISPSVSWAEVSIAVGAVSGHRGAGVEMIESGELMAGAEAAGRGAAGVAAAAAAARGASEHLERCAMEWAVDGCGWWRECLTESFAVGCVCWCVCGRERRPSRCFLYQKEPFFVQHNKSEKKYRNQTELRAKSYACNNVGRADSSCVCILVRELQLPTSP